MLNVVKDRKVLPGCTNMEIIGDFVLIFKIFLKILFMTENQDGSVGRHTASSHTTRTDRK